MLALVASAGPANADSAHPTRTSFKLFDLAAARADTALAAAYVQYRRTDREQAGRGLELRGGPAFSWEAGPLYVTSTSATALRVFSRRSYSLSILQNGGHAGLLLGPIDVGTGFAISVFNIDYLEDDLSFGMFTPRSLASAGVRFGPVRIGAQAHVEYLWRWFGRDYFVRGVAVTLDIQNPCANHPIAERRH